jgi:hypothetical protein
MKSKANVLPSKTVSPTRIGGLRTGVEDKKKAYLMLVLFSLAMLLLIHMFLSSSSSTTVVAARSSGAASAQSQVPGSFDQLTLRTDLLRRSEEFVYTGSGRNIFDAEPPIDTAISQPVAPVIVPSPPADELVAPPEPIPLKFFGFGSGGGRQKSIFLTNAGNVFIAHEGEIVDRRYKIMHISATQVEVEDIPTAHRETLALSHE